MKIATLNTWGSSGPWEKRWACLVEELILLKPDILFLQEVWNETLPEKIKEALSYAHLSASYEAGLVILSKYPAVFQTIHKYEVISPYEPYDRRALLIKTKINSRDFILANTHLSWKTEDGETRRKQAEELLRCVNDVKLSAILAGDFNDVPESQTIQTIKSGGFKDLFELGSKGQKGITWDNANPFIQSHETKFPDRRIDYLFLSGAFVNTRSALSCRVAFNRPNHEGIYPSDHYGVTAELKI